MPYYGMLAVEGRSCLGDRTVSRRPAERYSCIERLRVCWMTERLRGVSCFAVRVGSKLELFDSWAAGSLEVGLTAEALRAAAMGRPARASLYMVAGEERRGGGGRMRRWLCFEIGA